MKRVTLAVIAAAVALAGCGGGHAPSPAAQNFAHSMAHCPQAANGHGALGICEPKVRLHALTGATHIRVPGAQAVSGPEYPDLSNNDPCDCGAQFAAEGKVGLIVKAIQGTGFVDWTAAAMIASARAHGLAIGIYDFDADYSVAEARLLVTRAHALGIDPSTPNTFPLYLDVEWGAFSYTGLQAQIAYLRSAGYRVGIYTGQWYWAPHAGCRWPAGVSAWLSGYPVAPVPCGLASSLYNAHQFTSSPIDMTVFLGSRSVFNTFVKAGPPPPSPAQIKHWKGALAASERVYKRRGCPVLNQRIAYFSRELKAHPKTKVAYRRGALASSRRHYASADCKVFAQRIRYFKGKLKAA